MNLQLALLCGSFPPGCKLAANKNSHPHLPTTPMSLNHPSSCRSHLLEKSLLPHFPLSAHCLPALPWKLISWWLPLASLLWNPVAPYQSLFNSTSRQHLTANHPHLLAFPATHRGPPSGLGWGWGLLLRLLCWLLFFASCIKAGAPRILSESSPPSMHASEWAHHSLVLMLTDDFQICVSSPHIPPEL